MLILVVPIISGAYSAVNSQELLKPRVIPGFSSPIDKPLNRKGGSEASFFSPEYWINPN